MMADHLRGGGGEVRGGPEAGESGPEEVDGAGGGAARLAGEDHQGPAGEGGVGGEAGGGAGVVLIHGAANDQAAGNEDVGVRHPLGDFGSGEVAWEVAHRVAQAEPD